MHTSCGCKLCASLGVPPLTARDRLQNQYRLPPWLLALRGRILSQPMQQRRSQYGLPAWLLALRGRILSHPLQRHGDTFVSFFFWQPLEGDYLYPIVKTLFPVASRICSAMGFFDTLHQHYGFTLIFSSRWCCITSYESINLFLLRWPRLLSKREPCGER